MEEVIFGLFVGFVLGALTMLLAISLALKSKCSTEAVLTKDDPQWVREYEAQLSSQYGPAVRGVCNAETKQ